MLRRTLYLTLTLFTLGSCSEKKVDAQATTESEASAIEASAVLPKIEQVERVTITVENLETSLKFYKEVLHFEEVASYSLAGDELLQLTGLEDGGLSVKVVELSLGSETIALQEFSNESRISTIPEDSKSNDLWFQHIAIVVSDMDAAYAVLEEAGVEPVSKGPQTLPTYITAAAGIKAFYFKDPDNHNLEVIYYPEGKGDSKWQEADGELFLGIDHTAIGIEDTDASTDFYEDLLGFKTLGHSENYGPEQEALNNVEGARLWISGLGVGGTYNVEFLEYKAPEGGRGYPSDSRVTDLWHWQIKLKVQNLEKLYEKLKDTSTQIISDDIVTINDRKQLMIRDVDGHAILLSE